LRCRGSASLPASQFLAALQNVFGYELLFRNGVEDYFNADPEIAGQ
jgi:c-di-GMP-related signal transduction protein